jgi:UDP-3-O-[3-hydroxymyristoyl] glucosamine N-acyltransferase
MKTLSSRELSERLGCAEVGMPSSEMMFTGVGSLERAEASNISFLANPKYLQSALQSRAGGIVCAPSAAEELGKHYRGRIFTATDPYAVFARISQHFFEPQVGFEGRSPQAFIDVTASVHSSVTVFPFVFIGPGAVIGENSVLYAGVFVGAGSTVGCHSILYPNAVVREGCHVGERCILNPGAVVGGDGFGFAPSGSENVKIPQVGGVRLGNDVEVGSNSSIDRGAMDDTTVGEQTKIDSLVQVGHNVSIGKSCFLCGLVGVAGSATVGNRVTLAGQVGVGGHLSIADNVTILAKGGVASSVEEAGVYSGSPIVPHREWLKERALMRRMVKDSGSKKE